MLLLNNWSNSVQRFDPFFAEELEELVHLVGPVIKKCWMSAGNSGSGPGARPTPQSMGLFGARQNFIW